MRPATTPQLPRLAVASVLLLGPFVACAGQALPLGYSIATDAGILNDANGVGDAVMPEDDCAREGYPVSRDNWVEFRQKLAQRWVLCTKPSDLSRAFPADTAAIEIVIDPGYERRDARDSEPDLFVQPLRRTALGEFEPTGTRTVARISENTTNGFNFDLLSTRDRQGYSLWLIGVMYERPRQLILKQPVIISDSAYLKLVAVPPGSEP